MQARGRVWLGRDQVMIVPRPKPTVRIGKTGRLRRARRRMAHQDEVAPGAEFSREEAKCSARAAEEYCVAAGRQGEKNVSERRRRSKGGEAADRHGRWSICQIRVHSEPARLFQPDAGVRERRNFSLFNSETGRVAGRIPGRCRQSTGQ